MKVSLSTFIRKVISSKLIKDSASYTLLNVIEKAIPFLILPIITRMLTKEEVGIYILYQAIVEVLIPVMTLSIDATVLLNYYKENKDKFKEYLTNSILLFFVISIIFSVLINAWSEIISDLIKFPSTWLLVVCIIVFSRFFTQLRQHLWRINFKIKEYAIFTIGISILKNCIGLYLVIIYTMSWDGLIIGHLIGYAVFAVIGFVSIYFDGLLRFKFNLDFISDSLRVGIPLAVHNIGLWFGNAANRIIIASLLGSSATGSYGIGAVFGIIITVIEDAFINAFVPHLFDRLKKAKKGYKENIVKLTFYVYRLLLIISIFVLIGGYYGVDLIFGNEYTDTRIIIIPLVVAAMFKGFYKLHVNYIMFTKKTIKITQISITTGIINIIVAYYTTLRFGILGTAYTFLFISILQYIFTFYIGNKLIPMPWKKILINYVPLKYK